VTICLPLVPVGHVIQNEYIHQILTTYVLLETDSTFPKESRRRAEDILEEVKATYHVQIFSGVTHGFGTRGDPDVENSRIFL
jgi:Dienelactone hydrolase family